MIRLMTHNIFWLALRLLRFRLLTVVNLPEKCFRIIPQPGHRASVTGVLAYLPEGAPWAQGRKAPIYAFWVGRRELWIAMQ